MVVNKRKKVVKYRGDTTHGGGHRKKRRGAGSRGGRGNAGSGKRAGHKKAGGKVITGRNAFRPRRDSSKENTINVGFFTSSKLAKWLTQGKAVKEGDVFLVDLSKLGYTKLLGTGTVFVKLKLNIARFTPRAEEKIKAAGGEVGLSEKKE
jgi:large subunit ribosomal protein L15